MGAHRSIALARTMKTQSPTRQPGQHEIQPLFDLLNAGQLARAESAARALLERYPGSPVVHQLLANALAGQSKYAEAVDAFRKLVAANPRSAELHFNLAVVLSQAGRLEEAVTSYEKVIALAPHLADAHYNLGTSLQALGRLEPAAASYRRAVALEPGFFEAHGNLGAVLQMQGKLDEAVDSYRKALALHPDARGHFNLGTALANQGKLGDAIASYRQALALDPNHADAASSLGEALFHQGQPDEAVASYRHALAIDPSHAEANYNLGTFLYDAGELAQAIPCFERSQIRDWRERVLYCLYKTRRFQEFRKMLRPLLDRPHTSPFLATLSAHHAANFGVEDEYRFCRNPLDFVHHTRIDALAAPGSPLRAELLRDIERAEIAERKQGRLYHGIQSSGNLFNRPEASFRTLASLVRQVVESYRVRFAACDCELIRAFPRQIEFGSSWYVKMRTGGHLTSHIHETGWLSGSLYLAMPRREAGRDDGCIEFSTHGDDYPQQHGDFPKKTFAPDVGDIVLFPSSLFHRTIPFDADAERICIAFDVKPTTGPAV
jgi:uncharacterized protein (TIGR02466 family)